MGLFKKKFRMEHVYAGPEPANKHKGEYEMRDVYAGPEQMGIPESMRQAPDDFENENNRKEILKRVPPERRVLEDTRIQAVYAAPDVMPPAMTCDVRVDVPCNQPSYPLNNAAPITPMQTVYAAPDAFQRMLRANMENSEVIVPKGMASPGMPGSVCESGNADVEIIDCPECGEKTRHYKFCEYCGAILK